MNTQDLNNKLSKEQKLAKIMLALREIRPFYSCVYEVMTKVEREGLGSVGVTTNSLYYDPYFIESRFFNELLFVMLHEVGHISLQHVSRRENRDIQLWNIACDLFVNAVLAEEFNLGSPGTISNIKKYEIKFPNDALYCSTIDTDTDYVENIYYSLEEQAKNNGYTQATLSGLLSGQTFDFEYTGTKSGTSKKSGYYGITTQPLGDTHETFRIKLNPDRVKNDLIDEGADQNIKNQESSKLVLDATVRVEMNSSDVGTAPGKLQIIAKKLLKSELDWRKLLKRYLIQATSNDSSFNRPDKRMYYQKAIYPGQTQDEANMIKGVKVCIDTSGSVSDTDLEHFCGQVYNLVKQFKIEAELIYWDSKVESAGKFTGYKEFERVECYGRGGTAPEVVFEYFDSKQCKVKPIVTIMFTDGYFWGDWATPKMKKQYKDTIWIMTKEYNKDFEVPFGKKAIAKFK